MQIPLFPLNSVVFPGTLQTLVIFEDRYKKLLRRCLDDGIPFGVALIKKGREVAGPAEPYSVGTLAHIVQVDRVQGDRFRIVCQMGDRFRITTLDRRSHEYLAGEVELYPDEPAAPPAMAMVAQRVTALFDEYYRYLIALTGGWQKEAARDDRTLMFDVTALERRSVEEPDPARPETGSSPTMLFRALPEDPATLANTVASHLSVHANAKQELLECSSALLRLQKEAEILAEELQGLEERLQAQNRRRASAFGMSN